MGPPPVDGDDGVENEQNARDRARRDERRLNYLHEEARNLKSSITGAQGTANLDCALSLAPIL